MAINFDEASRRLHEKFPDLTLEKFSGIKDEVVLRCPVHGEQHSSRFANVEKSALGCPECGRLAGWAARNSPAWYKDWVWDGPLSSEELTQKRELLKYAYDRVQKARAQKSVKVSVDELLEGPNVRVWSSDNPIQDPDAVFIPFKKEIELAAGPGTFEVEDSNGFNLAFSRASLRRIGVKIENAYCYTVAGDSMEPMLPDGCAIGVDYGSTEIRDGKVYAIEHGGIFRVKILIMLPNGRVRLRSVNRDYDDEDVPLDEIRVLGKVFWSSALYH